MRTDNDKKRKGVFSSPLAITGIILLVCALLLLGMVLVLGAEPTHTFYAILSAGLGFLAINPAVVRMRNSQLWQGMLIGAVIASICWMIIT